MKNSNMIRLLICILFSLLLICSLGIAAAEEAMETVQLELFSEGGYPTDPPMQMSMFGVNPFDDYIIAELYAQNPEINILSFNLTIDEAVKEFRRVLNQNPELFFIGGKFTYFYNRKTLIVSRIVPLYKYSGSTLESKQAIYENGVNEIVQYALAADTDVGRMLRANDYMCANYEYDIYSPEDSLIRSPELMFENKYGVCHAYMLIYRAVLNELGIPNVSIRSEEMKHTWNLVYLDGSWYHVDVTWNDPLDDIPLRACHTNFLLSDDGITERGHRSWDDGYEDFISANNTKYDNYFWKGLRQPVTMKGDDVYYIESDHSIDTCFVYAYDLATESRKQVCSFAYGRGSYYIGIDPVVVAGDTIYYVVRDSVYSIDMNGQNKTLIYNSGNSQKWLLYPYLTGSTLRICEYNIETKKPGQIHTCKLPIHYALAVEPAAVRTDIGSSVQLKAALTPDHSNSIDIIWSSSNENIAVVNENGLVTAVGGGIVSITAAVDDTVTAVCTMIVNVEEMMYLPADMRVIDAEAFMNTAAGMVEIPNNVTTIGSRAFANNDELILVVIPESVDSIAPDAFSGSANVTLLCVAGSRGEAYAIANSIPYLILP